MSLPSALKFGHHPRVPRFAVRFLSPLFSILLVAATAILPFLPNVNSYFVADDFMFLHYLHFFSGSWGDLLGWIIRTDYGGPQFIRPVVQALFAIDHALWGVNPLGYHLSNLALHLANSLLLAGIAFLLLRNWAWATIAGALFASHPAHSEPVNWISGRSDLSFSTFYLAALLLFVWALDNGHGTLAKISGSVAMFVLALGAKEMAVSLPLVLGVWVVATAISRSDWDRRQFYSVLPFLALLVVYTTVRLFVFGGVGGYGADNSVGDVLAFLSSYGKWLTEPLPVGLLPWFGGTAGGLVLLCLSRPDTRLPVLLSSGLLVLSLAPVITTGPSERFTYLPSAAYILLLVSLAARLPLLLRRGGRAGVSAALLAGLVVLAAWGSVLTEQRSEGWQKAGAAVRSDLAKLKDLFPVADGSLLLARGLPDSEWGALEWRTGFPHAVQLLYEDTTIEARRVDRFPLAGTGADRTLFLDFEGTGVVDRTAELTEIERRHRQLKEVVIGPGWEFAGSRDGSEWQPWSGISSIESRNGQLLLKASTEDPYIVGPRVDIPVEKIAYLKIRMSVRAAGSGGTGEVFWAVGDGPAFSGERSAAFATVQDGRPHNYRIDLVGTGKMFLGERLRYLRLDPAKETGEITIDFIRVYMMP